MSIKLAGHLFTGPFPVDTTEVRANQVPVVYAVIAKEGQSWAPTFRVIDLGASPDEGLRFSDHPQRSAWGEPSISVYLLYLPRTKHTAADREQLATELRRHYDPPNGFVS